MNEPTKFHKDRFSCFQVNLMTNFKHIISRITRLKFQLQVVCGTDSSLSVIISQSILFGSTGNLKDVLFGGYTFKNAIKIDIFQSYKWD